MSKQYGLIVPNKETKKSGLRPSIFDESSSDSDQANAKPTGLTKTVRIQHQTAQSRALEEDPTVYQYDEVYDEIDRKRKESKLSRKDLDRKPKYIGKLMETAEKRKREHERRIGRQVQKERELEGEEFRDKEEFVTGSYKKKLEEMKVLEEEEKREEYLEEIGDVRKQGNLDGFYRHLYDQKVNFEANTSEEKIGNKRKYRKRQESESNSDDETGKQTKKVDSSVIIEKKEHLQSNLDADSDFSIDSESDEEDKSTETKDKLNENIEIKVEINKKDLDDGKKEVKEEEKANTDEIVEEPTPKIPKIDIWKKRTVGEVFDEAVKRYFQRRAIREL